MKIDWKEVDKNVMGAMGSAIAACAGGTLLAGAVWIFFWVMKQLAILIRSLGGI